MHNAIRVNVPHCHNPQKREQRGTDEPDEHHPPGLTEVVEDALAEGAHVEGLAHGAHGLLEGRAVDLLVGRGLRGGDHDCVVRDGAVAACVYGCRTNEFAWL